ncbi:MAG: EAL domain-containing protein [Actinomycetota bacterium]|nr:EAL domain-containing protein [Actinomycetota bacterium]
MHAAVAGDPGAAGALARLTGMRGLALVALTAAAGGLPLAAGASDAATAAHAAACALLATVCWLRRPDAARRERIGWTLLALAGAVTTMLYTTTVVADLADTPYGEQPVVLLVGFAVASVCGGVAILLILPWPTSLSELWRSLFDSVAVAGCIVLAVWQLVIEPWASTEEVGSGDLSWAVGGPALFGVVSAYAAIVGYRRPSVARRCVAIAVATVVAAGASSYVVVSATSGTTPSPWFVSASFHTAITLLIVAGLQIDDPSRPAVRIGGWVDVVVPCAALAGFVPLAVLEGRDDFEPLSLAITAAVGGAVVVRQTLAVIESTVLSRELEQRVLLRTVELERREARQRALVENLNEGIAVVDRNGTFRWASPATERFAGHEPGGLTGLSSMELIHPSDARRAADFFAELVDTPDERRTNVRIRNRDGGWREVETVGKNLLDEPGVWGIVLTMRDLTALQTLRRELADRTHYDALTGLLSGSFLLGSITEALDDPAGSSVALIVVDLDHFRDLIDVHGRPAGDDVVNEAAARIASVAGDGVLVGRFESDEFGLVLTGPGDHEHLALAAERIAERVVAVLRDPIEQVGASVTASVGFGVSEPGCSADELVRRAGLAVTWARTHGRDHVERYSPAMHVELVGRLRLHEDLSRAVDDDQLRVYYQPIVRVVDGRIIGAEALVRWQHPVDGLRSPGDFIEVAEQTGLIVPIGAWVLEEATRELARWSAGSDRHGELMLSVNVSAVQLRDPGLVAVVERALCTTGIDPARLVLEITESVVVAPELGEVLGALRALGVGIAIDDFGTGYSSLSYLRDFAIDVVKIDRSFVRDAGRGSAQAGAIIGGVTALAAQLGLRIVAEGVEGPPELVAVRRAGCGFAQGFHFAKPLTPAVFAARIGDQSAAGGLRGRLGGLAPAGGSPRHEATR